MRDVAGAAPRGSSRFDSKSISGGVSLDVTSSIDEWKYGRWYAARAGATADGPRGAGVEGRQVVRGARGGDGDRARGVEAEEPDAGIAAAEVDVRADVDLVEARDPWQRRRQHRAHAAERERHQADVGVGGERVDRQLRRNERLELLRRHLPMQKEEVMPVLSQDHGRIGLERRRDAIDLIQVRHLHVTQAMFSPDRIAAMKRLAVLAAMLIVAACSSGSQGPQANVAQPDLTFEQTFGPGDVGYPDAPIDVKYQVHTL